jgi:transposase InsO family protein
VSDNGPQFTSEEFKRFMLINGIVHRREAPYHPQTNGLAERAVQSVKKALHKMRDQPGTFEDKLQRFFTSYQNTPHKSTGKTPVEELLGRQNRGKFDLFQPTDLIVREPQ